MALGSRFFLIFALLLLVASSACAPSVSNKLGVPKIPRVASAAGGASGYETEIFLEDFIDNRTSGAIARYKQKEVELEGDVVPPVMSEVRRILKKAGFRISDFAPITLTGGVQRWFANITNEGTGKIQSEAVLTVDVRDPANKRIYSGTYSGYASFEGSSLGDNELKKSLGTAMSEAIGQILVDKDLVNLLSSF